MKESNRNRYFVGNVSSFIETKGYVIGHFMGSRGFPLLETEEVEIAWKKLPEKFDEEPPHFHRRGIEITVVISHGYELEVNGELVKLRQGDFLVVYPETFTRNVSALPNTEVIVIKAPSISNDKFYVVDKGKLGNY